MSVNYSVKHGEVYLCTYFNSVQLQPTKTRKQIHGYPCFIILNMYFPEFVI